jgi:hypothetical protein
VLRLFALAAAVAIASPVLAQNNPLGQAPSTPPGPFQEKGAGIVTGTPGLVTPQRQTGKLEAWAKEREAKHAPPLERETYYSFLHAHDRAEAPVNL